VKIVVQKRKLKASIYRESFYEFLLAFWGTTVSEKLVDNWHIKFLCDELQVIAERVFKREPKKYDLVINISPGSTKSTICSVMFPVWCWIRDPSIRTICGSYSSPLSLYLATQSRNILQSDEFKAVFPEIQLIETGKQKIANLDKGVRITTSTGGAITGMHGHFIIIDDPVSPKEAMSKVQIKTANDWLDQTLMSRRVDVSITPTILIMQRLHQDDPTGHMLGKREKGEIRHICLPAIITKDVRPRTLRKKYIGRYMDPIRLSETTLRRMKISLNDWGFAGQYLQSPYAPGGNIFKTERILIDVPPNKMIHRVRYWDKAGTFDGGAYTVGALLSKDKSGRFWVLDVVRGQWDAYEREQVIKRTAEIDGKDVIIGVEQEPGSGGKESAQNTVKHLAGFRVQVDRPVGSKVKRAYPFASVVNGGIVRIVKGLWNQTFLGELEYFPNGNYLDQVDASSAAFALITKQRRKIGGLGR
jgi:predicted phage terminase large subunit-like protein